MGRIAACGQGSDEGSSIFFQKEERLQESVYFHELKASGNERPFGDFCGESLSSRGGGRKVEDRGKVR